MSNTFKVGNKVTITPNIGGSRALAATIDTTKGKVYTLTSVGLACHTPQEARHRTPSAEPDAVALVDDVGYEIELHYKHVTLVQEH